jgi:hypothetical protein
MIKGTNEAFLLGRLQPTPLDIGVNAMVHETATGAMREDRFTRIVTKGAPWLGPIMTTYDYADAFVGCANAQDAQR